MYNCRCIAEPIYPVTPPRKPSELDIRVAYRQAWDYLLNNWRASTPRMVAEIHTAADLEAVCAAADHMHRNGLLSIALALAAGAELALGKLERSPFSSPWAVDDI